MDILFSFLLLGAFIGLIVGLIEPPVFKKVLGAKANRKTIGLVFGGIIVLLFILIGVTAPDTTKTTKPATTTATKPATTASTPAPATKTPTTMDLLWIALDKGDKYGRDNADIHYNESEKNAELIKYSSIGDSNYVVEESYNKFVNFAQQAFLVPNVDSITMTETIDLIDKTTGEKSKGNAISFKMTKDNFNKVNWDNFRDTAISLHDNIVNNSEFYNVSPAITEQGLDNSKLFLSGK